MNVDNRILKIDNRACAFCPNPLSARGAAGWRRGYAADCKSDQEISDFSHVFSAVSRNLRTDKNPRQTANASETLTTAWWLIPAALLGAAIWALLIVEVMG